MVHSEFSNQINSSIIYLIFPTHLSLKNTHGFMFVNLNPLSLEIQNSINLFSTGSQFPRFWIVSLMIYLIFLNILFNLNDGSECWVDCYILDQDFKFDYLIKDFNSLHPNFS